MSAYSLYTILRWVLMFIIISKFRKIAGYAEKLYGITIGVYQYYIPIIYYTPNDAISVSLYYSFSNFY